ncbi:MULTISPECIES: cobalt ECF transporter T component CbiQ [Cyanophyceae]|uniref:Cobalt ECF transporter T component CbiQ n=1 Tax=Leptolyngbya subtilissima DQ-A4 TaxID=2933933 RepID=A0ABV0K1T9_9CYAN|nr:cobalt ECF transporter T component CbiQ [Nodosilinea sp. FACHB-141]MBD2111521.1 cobalt ECF transporter T component CbiQ [Nodosilinea sp. FACHB-141]
MGAASLDTYVHRESVIHRWSPRLKLVSLVALMFAFAMVRQLTLVPWMLGLAAALYGLSGLPVSFLRQRLSYPGLFILSLVVVLPLTVGDTVLGQWGWLTLRQEGLQATLLIVGRFLSILTLGFILLGTTPFLTLLHAMRSLGLPTILADMTLLSYRYLFEIAAMLATMQQAMRLRGFGQRRQRWLRINGQMMQQLAMLAGNLLIRSYEQSDRVYRAMRLRGYGYGGKIAVGQSAAAQPSTLSWGLAAAVLTAAVSLVIAEGLLRL